MEDDEKLARALQMKYEQEAQRYARRQRGTRAQRSSKTFDNTVREARREGKPGDREDLKKKKESSAGQVRYLDKNKLENDHNIPNLSKVKETGQVSSEAKTSSCSNHNNNADEKGANVPNGAMKNENAKASNEAGTRYYHNVPNLPNTKETGQVPSEAKTPNSSNHNSLGNQKGLQHNDDEKGEKVPNAATKKQESKPSNEAVTRKSSFSRVTKKSKLREISRKDSGQGASINVEQRPGDSPEERNVERSRQYRRPKRRSNKVREEADVNAPLVAPNSSNTSLKGTSTDQIVMSEEKRTIKERVPDTSKDEEIAKRLSREMNRGRRRRQPRRISERLNNDNSGVRGRTSEKIIQRPKNDPETCFNEIAPVNESTKHTTPEISMDKEIANQFRDAVKERSKPRSGKVPDQPDYIVREAPETAKNDLTNEQKEEEECTIASFGTNFFARNDQKCGNPKDEEFARQLATELAAEATANTTSKQTTKHEKEITPEVDVEREERDNEKKNSQEESKLDGEVAHNEKITDVSKDEELARQLAAELAAEATANTTSKQTPEHEKEINPVADVKREGHDNDKKNSQEESKLDGEVAHNEKITDVSKDEEFARQLAAELAAETTANTTSKQTPEHEKERAQAPGAKGNKNSTLSKDEEVTLSISKDARKPTDEQVVHCEAKKDLNDVEDDEALAKRLEQELQDEDFARQLNEKEMKRRRRANYLARKQASERQRTQEAKTSNGNETTALDSAQEGRSQNTIKSESLNDASGTPSSKTTHNAKEKRPRSPTLSVLNNTGTKCNERVSNNHSREISPKRSREKSVSPKRSRERSMSPKPNNATQGRLSPKTLDQERKDAELAMALANAPTRISIYHLPEPDSAKEKKNCSVKRAMPYLIIAVVVAGTIVGVVLGLTGGSDSSATSKPPFEPFPDDPFDGRDTKWNTIGTGLTLNVQNALTDNWESIFSTAINDWGRADSLELNVQKIRHDPACEVETGVLKVCNANYGKTRWRGLNQVILQDNFIISSVAMLNEEYLGRADDAQRQYTMCHEIGHGFGLKHTDEDFYNEDLGNCMDYTSNPQANKSPSQMNFYELAQLYGLRNRRSMIRSSNLKLKSSSKITPELRDRINLARAKYEAKSDDIFLNETENDKSEVVSLGGGYELIFNELPVN